MRSPGSVWHAARGTAALEFALTLPVLLMFLAGVTDFGLLYNAQAAIAGAVTAGAQYAYLTGINVAPGNITTVVMQASGLAVASGTQPLSVSVTGPACYCVTGAPPALTSYSCGASCPDTTPAGTYVVINASYTYHGMMPALSSLGVGTITQSATVRLK